MGHFTNIRDIVASAEGRNVDHNHNDANNLRGDWHVGYQQLSGRSIFIFTEYLKKKINGSSIPDLEDFYDKLFSAVSDETTGKSKQANYNCTLFPTIFTKELQELFHCIYLADSLKNRDTLTYEEIILYNASGKYGNWSVDQLNNEMYPSGKCRDINGELIVKTNGKPAFKSKDKCEKASTDNTWSYNVASRVTFLEYLSGSLVAEQFPANNIDTTRLNTVSTNGELSKVFISTLTNDELFKDLQEYVGDLHDRSIEIQKLVPAKSALVKGLSKNSIKSMDTSLIYSPIYWASTASPALASANPISVLSFASGTPQAPSSTSSSLSPFNVPRLSSDNRAEVAMKAFEEQHGNAHSAAIYRDDKLAKENGLLYIGDILFSIPPSSVRFSTNNQVMAIPTMRTEGDPLFKHNNTIPRVDLTLFFNGADAINTQLRPLLAMFSSCPFTTIQNTTVFNSWIGRKSGYPDSNGDDKVHGFYPIPCYLENISFSTIPGFPNSVQAHISVSRMNRAPFGIEAKMWRYWDDAKEQAINAVIRHSMDNTILSAKTDPISKDKDVFKIIDSTHQVHTISSYHQLAKNPNAQKDKITSYPQESIPFQYLYRERLMHEDADDILNLRHDGSDKDPFTHWPAYKNADNSRLYFTYKAPKRFRTPELVFKKRIDDLVKQYNKVQVMVRIVASWTDEEFKANYAPMTKVDFNGILSAYLGTVSSIKKGKEFAKNLNVLLKGIVEEVVNSEIMTTHISNDAESVTYRDPVSGLERTINLNTVVDDSKDFTYVSDDNVVTDALENLLLSFNALMGEPGECAGSNTSAGTGALSVGLDLDTLTKKEVKSLQTHLVAFGTTPIYNDKPPGSDIDGNMGPKTKAAYNNWVAAQVSSSTNVTYITKESCESAGNAWTEKLLTKEERINRTKVIEAIFEPFTEALANNPAKELGLEDLDATWNFDNVGVELSWLTDKDRLNTESSILDSFVTENEHSLKSNTTAHIPYLYQFQSVLQSINYSYSNNVVPVFTTSSSLPTYQHMGSPAPTVSLIFKTRDERFLKVVTDMQESIQEVGRHLAAGDTNFAGFGTVDITGNLFAQEPNSATGPLSGHLLNSVGFTQCAIKNVSAKSIEGSPGWWDIHMELISDTQNIRLREYLTPATQKDFPDTQSLTLNYFPTHDFYWDHIDDYLKSGEVLEELDKLQKRIEFQKYFGRTKRETKAMPQDYTAYYSFAARKLEKDMHNIVVKEVVKSVALSGKDFLNVYIDSETNEISLTVNNNKKNEFYQKALSKIIEQLETNLINLDNFEKERRTNDEYNETFIEQFSMTAALRGYYVDYLTAIVYTLSTTARTSPHVLLDPENRRGLFPQPSTALNISSTTVFIQSLILLNQVKVNFTGMFRRGDFRDFLAADKYKTSKDQLSEEIKKHTDSITKLNVTIDENSKQTQKYIDKLEEVKVAPEDTVYPTWTEFRKALTKSEKIAELKRKIKAAQDDGSLEEEISKLEIIINDINNDPIMTTVSYTGIEDIYREFIKELNEGIKSNYPDLRLPKESLDQTGHRYFSPGFPFVDNELDLEVTEMGKMADQVKLATFAQFAGIMTGKFGKYYSDVEEALGEKGITSMNAVMVKSIKFPNSNLSVNWPKHMGSCSDPTFETANECTSNNKTWGLDIESMFKFYHKAGEGVSALTENLDNEEFKKANKSETLALSKETIMNLMATTAFLDYMVLLIYASNFVKGSTKAGALTDDDLKSFGADIVEQLRKIEVNKRWINITLGTTLMTQFSKEIKVSDKRKTKEAAAALSTLLLQKRTSAADLATISATGNWQAFSNYFGIGDVTSIKKSYELRNTFNQYLQLKRKGTMERAFPAFKLFFIEEDNYQWQAFDDFYTYDAVSEITIIESKHAASKTAVLKLSNVTSNLTNDLLEGMLNEQSSSMPGEVLKLKVGTQLMILVGYGADYRQLRMKFKGAITEMQPGPVIEITAQSWGAGLLNNVGAMGGTEYSALSGATSMGAAVLDILSNTPGLRHLGRWEMRDPSRNSIDKVSETTLENVYYARMLNSVAGSFTEFIPIKNNIREVLGGFKGEGLPTDYPSLQQAARNNNSIVKSVGNSLYDNIIINDTKPNGYGLFNWFTRLSVSMSDIGEQKFGFQWIVFRQSAWDSLHEISLFMGDYIVTTLPFNEGNDLFNNPPRETLYMGPREGQYRAQTYVPKINIDSELQEYKKLIKTILEDEAKLKNRNVALKALQKQSQAAGYLSHQYIQDEYLDPPPKINVKSNVDTISEISADRKSIISLGKILLSQIVNYHATVHTVYAGADDDTIVTTYGVHGGDTSTITLDKAPDDDLLKALESSATLNGFKKYAKLIKKTATIKTSQQHQTQHRASTEIISKVRILADKYITKNAIHEILLNDFEHAYDTNKLPEYAYNKADFEIIGLLRAGAINSITEPFMYLGKEDKFFKYGLGSSVFQRQHNDSVNSALGYMLCNPTNSNVNADAVYFEKILKPFMQEVDNAIYEDTKYYIETYEEIRKSMARDIEDIATNPFIMKIEEALLNNGGITNLFAYKPVVQHHSVNSYEDIIDNSIVATADQMYNHVEVLYSSEPTIDASSAQNRAQAYISYDQDPDYLRSYQTFQKNIDPNIFLDVSSAQAYHDSAVTAGGIIVDERLSTAHMLRQHAVAQQVLMNVVKPMYQGTLSMIGNPHIRPWDILHIHDDSLSMYGPIEVEQVVTTISATEGYTTTIVPNLVVHYKNASKALDNLIMNVQETIRMAGYLSAALEHGSIITGGFMTLGAPTILKGAGLGSGGLFGSTLNSAITKAEKAVKSVKKINQKNFDKKRKLAKKLMAKSNFEAVEDAVKIGENKVKHAKRAETRSKRVARKLENGIEAIDRLAEVQEIGDKRKSLIRKASSMYTEADEILKKVDGKYIKLGAADKEKVQSLRKGAKGALRYADDLLIYTDPEFKMGPSNLKKYINNSNEYIDDAIKFFADIGVEGEALIDDESVKNLDKKVLKKQIQEIKKLKTALTESLAAINKQSDIIEELMKEVTKHAEGSKAFKLGEVELKAAKAAKDAAQKAVPVNIKKGLEVGKEASKRIVGGTEEVAEKLVKNSLDDAVKALGSKATLLGGATKLLNWAGWAYTVYEIGAWAWDSYSTYARSKIFMAGLLAGENQLVFSPLEYKGKDYVAGLEGIVGTPRGVSTILYGEMADDITNSNRSLLVLDMLARQEV